MKTPPSVHNKTLHYAVPIIDDFHNIFTTSVKVTDVFMFPVFYFICFNANILILNKTNITIYEGWNFNSGNYLFTTDTK